jgi:hypothetical protein
MEQVDTLLVERTGTSSSDLPDFAWQDAFDAGEEPKDVVEEFLREEGLVS